MPIALADLVARLQAAIPPRDSVPSAEDYAQHVQDAVLQFSQDAPVTRSATLSIIKGVGTYELPADFLFLIELEALAHPTGVRVTPDGLVPVPLHWLEHVEVVGEQITFAPTPDYSMERHIRYAARHMLDESESYPNLTQNGARVALLYAQYLALTQQANVVAGDGWRYQIGDEMVDKSRQGDGLRGQAQAALDAYVRAMRGQKGYGRRGQGDTGRWAC